MVKHVCILRVVQLKSELQPPDRPQYKRLATCVIAQQYFPVTFARWRLHSHKKNVGALFKNAVSFLLFFLKLRNSENG
jgi:hypothetical protein